MRKYINFFYDLASDSKRNGDYDYAFVMENVGNLINNVGHGIPASDFLARVRDALVRNRDSFSSDDAKYIAYLDAIDMIDMFISEL